MRILVADDELQICRLVRDILQPSGYSIDSAKDGREFFQRYRTGDYSLLILDTLLMELSGLELVTRLRHGGDAVPIILMFGPRKQPRRMESLAFSYRVDLLRKPFGIGELRAAVSRALGEPRPD
jgi:two-component system alkaline phosphatase synthesis response regulator PhoP